MNNKPVLNLREVAQLIKRSTKSVRNYIKAGKLKASKIESVNGPEYVFDQADVVAFAREFLSIDLVMGEAVSVPLSPNENPVDIVQSGILFLI